MKKYYFLFIYFLFFNFNIQSQNRINLDIGYGYYLNNSENSMKIVGDKRFRSYFFFGISFQKEDLFGYNLMVEYSYHEITKKNVIEFVRIGEDSPEPLDILAGTCV